VNTGRWSSPEAKAASNRHTADNSWEVDLSGVFLSLGRFALFACRHGPLARGWALVGLVAAQVAAVAFVLGFSPFYRGVLERLRARLFFRVGPPVIQPYRDLRKWFAKETVRSRRTTWISALAPVVYFSAPVIVAMLIPVLTRGPLPLAFMADMLGGGFVLGAGGFFLLLHALESGSPYSGLGTSRVRLVAVFAEPLVTLVIFAAAAVGRSTVPFVVNTTLASPRWVLSAAHVLVLVAWFLFWIAETGRIPVDNPTSTAELSLIDPARVFEASGPDLALYEWGGWMKFTIIGLIGVNVLGTPWGLAPTLGVFPLAGAMLASALKLLVVGCFLVFFEASLAKLRLLRIPEFVTASSLFAFLAVVAAVLS
jgi:formate hydrogenlyase subunit 4